MDYFKSSFEIKSNHKKRATLVCMAFFLLLFICITCVAVYSYKYQDAHQTPKSTDGTFDFSEMDSASGKSQANLSGEWEFFYNQWIETDKVEKVLGHPDAIVSVPHRWRGMELNGETLTSYGYGSYRVTLKGLETGTNIRIWQLNYIGSYRVFINGILTTSYGEMTRDNPWCVSNGSPEYLENYQVKDTQPIEVVVEVGCSREGGFSDSFWMDIDGGPAWYYTFINNMGMVAFGIASCLVLFTIIVNVAMHKKEREWSFAVVIFVYFFQTIFSVDFFWQICSQLGSMSYNIILEVNFIVGLLLAIVAIVHFEKVKAIHLPSLVYCLLGVAAYILVLSFYSLWGDALRIVPYAIMVFIIGLMSYPLALRFSITGRRENIVYIVLLFINLAFNTVAMMDLMGIIRYGVEGWISLSVILNTMTFTVLFWMKMRTNFAVAVDEEKLINEVSKVKTQALRAQIKPHFIFNSLTSIQHLYHQSIDQGDRAMELFSRHMRTNVNADNRELIPFSEELANIDNFCKLNEMRLGYPISLILDIECTSFEVPPLSLQPIVENAIKYAMIHLKEDGHVMVQSRENDDYIFIIVSDNGIGFDVDNISENSTGLRNLTERFKIALNARVNIFSKPGEGTTVEIGIPKRRNYEYYRH